MRKLICIALAVLIFAAPVMAAEVDQYAAIRGMG